MSNRPFRWGMLKQNLEVDQKVRIGRTSDPNLDDSLGTILGKSGDHLVDFYIVLLDKPYNGQKAINMIETCIEPLIEE